MARDTCKYWPCDEEPGAEETDRNYDDRRFCSPFHELKYEHIKADAEDARIADMPDDPDPHDGRPEGPPY